MKYIDEFRDGEVARTLALKIAAEAKPERSYSFMEFCGDLAVTEFVDVFHNATKPG